MDDTRKQLQQLQTDLAKAIEQLAIATHEQKLHRLQQQSRAADFWQDNQSAQAVMKQIASLETRITPWRALEKEVDDAVELANMRDTSLHDDLTQQAKTLQAQFDELKQVLRFTGPYDDHNAIVSIHAGAGGTDAQDWTQMLFRMYSRWAEKNSLSISVIDESAGEEAGL